MEEKHAAAQMQSTLNPVANVGTNQQTSISTALDSADNAPITQDTMPPPNAEDNTSQPQQTPPQNNEEGSVQTDANETPHILDGTFTMEILPRLVILHQPRSYKTPDFMSGWHNRAVYVTMIYNIWIIPCSAYCFRFHPIKLKILPLRLTEYHP